MTVRTQAALKLAIDKGDTERFKTIWGNATSAERLEWIVSRKDSRVGPSMIDLACQHRQFGILAVMLNWTSERENWTPDDKGHKERQAYGNALDKAVCDPHLYEIVPGKDEIMTALEYVLSQGDLHQQEVLEISQLLRSVAGVNIWTPKAKETLADYVEREGAALSFVDKVPLVELMTYAALPSKPIAYVRMPHADSGYDSGSAVTEGGSRKRPRIEDNHNPAETGSAAEALLSLMAAPSPTAQPQPTMPYVPSNQALWPIFTPYTPYTPYSVPRRATYTEMVEMAQARQGAAITSR
jgi:hypothetical protein